jgi:PTS system mannitol-specific IIC component
MREQIQKFGKSLSSMVMPNIGAFIAWGLITALFIPTGWLPNEKLAVLVGPMLKFLLPLLIAYTGGKNVGGSRGGVIAAVATMGVVVGSDVPMFIGAMIMGPFAGWVIKKFDQAVEGKVPAGFEMLVNNFSIGIFGMILAIIGYFTVGQVISVVVAWLSTGIRFLLDNSMMPLLALLIEPEKVLFLNNAVNHGIFTPIGAEQAREFGSTMVFLLDPNPGPGLGILLASWMFGRGNAKESAPGAVIIHFLGGIHEIYFPYILARPVLIVSAIAGSATGIVYFTLTHSGLVAPASPGSIISIIAMSPKGTTLVVVLGVLLSAVVSFLVATPFVKHAPAESEDEGKAASQEGVSGKISVKKEKINKVIFACDAGMGSSAMGATRFRNRLQKSGISISISNSSVDHIPVDTDVVVCQASLSQRACKSAPEAELVIIEDFLNHENIDKLFNRIIKDTDGSASVPTESIQACAQPENNSILAPGNILTGLESVSKEEAICKAGELLFQGGYVEHGYIGAMLQREELTTTYLGMGIAVPHGTSGAKEKIIKTGIVVLQYPQGVSFGDEKAHLIIGIAGIGDEHLEILARISTSLDDEQVLQKLITTADKQFILDTLG